MTEQFDLLIIGSGIAGLTVAEETANRGLRVGVVEGYEWGGTTPNHGSTSKKYLLSAVEKMQGVAEMQGKGFSQTPKINWSKLVHYMQGNVQRGTAAIYADLKAKGIETISGTAVFVDEQTIEVKGSYYAAKQFVLATGARPRVLDIEGKEYFKTSKDFFALEELPASLTIVGAGIIAFAITNIANACGDEVNVLQHDNRALAAFDQDYVKELVGILKQWGVNYYFDHSISKIQPEGERYQVETTHGDRFLTDAVFCVAGRIPNVENLGLEQAGITYDDHGIVVDEYMRTTNPRIYAVGDCAADVQPKLANYAEFDGHYVAQRLLKKTLQPINYPRPAMSVFTNPKLAQAGVLINDALQQPERYTIKEYDLSDWLTYRRSNEIVAKAKTVIDKVTNKVVGITSISEEADLLINYAALIFRSDLSAEELTETIFAYPSMAHDLRRLLN